MIDHVVHPAIAQLLHFQARARLRRILRGFSTPRRFLLSCLGLVLAVVWLGNAAISILMRQPIDPARFTSLVSLGMMAYGLWHVLKVTCYRPQEPIELSPAERELLCGAPFRRLDLVVYRMAAILTAASLKALCFSLLMIPDLQLWAAGFVGSLLALLCLDLLRMVAEIVACGVSDRVYRRLRAVVVALTSVAAGSALVTTLCSPYAWLEHGSSLGFLRQLAKATAELRLTWIGVLVESPCRMFTRVITAEDYTFAWAGYVALSLALLGAMAYLVVRLDAHFLQVAVRTERQEYQRQEDESHLNKNDHATDVDIPTIPFRLGVGPVAWRQGIGAHRHATGLVLALAAPGVLACIPWVVQKDTKMASLEVIGALAFYSFLLLPSALKFDFRRDFDRLALLKTVPIRPAALVIGQIAVPVLLASGFQLIVLLVSEMIRPFHPGILLVALLLLLPLNVFVFALDNLIYLLYPYRLTQEGLEIFIRATLTFTAKGLLFAVAMALTVGWSLLAAMIAKLGSQCSGMAIRGSVVFLSGTCVAIILCAVAATYLLARAFQRFDPSEDMPG